MQISPNRYFYANGKESYKLVFTSLYPVMALYANKMVNDYHVAEDIAQEVFVELWQQRSKFESFNHVKAFLYLSVKNKCLNHKKHEAVKEKYNASAEHITDEADENIIEVEVINNLYSSINSLPEQQKQVIVCSMQGLKNEEIAEQLRISINTVKHHKKAAYLHLRNKVNKQLLLLLTL
jgi:RNA polymerase sigma-70 factor (ECF subfamily)